MAICAGLRCYWSILCWSQPQLGFKQKGFDTSSSNSKEFHSAESISETTTLKTPKAPLDGTGGSFQLASNLKLSHGESETGASKTQTQPTCPGTRLQGLGQLKQKLVQAWKYSPRSQKLKRWQNLQGWGKGLGSFAFGQCLACCFRDKGKASHLIRGCSQVTGTVTTYARFEKKGGGVLAFGISNEIVQQIQLY